MQIYDEGPRDRGPSSITDKSRVIVALTAAALLGISACSPDEQVQAPRTTTRTISSTSGSPLSGCRADASTTRRGTKNGSGEVEPIVAVDPGDPERIAVAWQQDRWLDGASRGLVVSVTTDGGETWETSSETKMSVCTGGDATNGGNLPRVTDPWLSFGASGELHLMGLALNLDAQASVGANEESVLVSSTLDNGKTWSDPETLIRDEKQGSFHDKPTLTADPHDEDSLYAVWHRLVDTQTGSVDGDTFFARSTDGGASWEPARSILGPIEEGQSFGNEIVVLPRNDHFDGELVNVFGLIEFEGAGGGEKVTMSTISSSDAGRTWSKPVSIASVDAAPVLLPGTRRELKTGRLLPRVAVDPISGVMYVAWSDSSFEGGRFNDVALSISEDGGRSWSAPVKVNQTPALRDVKARQTFTPEVAVTSEGEVAVSYYDFRNSERVAEGVPTDLFISRCREPDPAQDDACAGEWIETRVTESSFDMTMAPDSGGPFLGDYIGLAGAGPRVVVAFPYVGGEEDPASVGFEVLEPLGPEG